MRTTLELDDDLVRSAKDLAKERGTTLGEVISELVRKSLPSPRAAKMRNGVQVFESAPGAPGVDMEFVNRLRDEE